MPSNFAFVSLKKSIMWKFCIQLTCKANVAPQFLAEKDEAFLENDN